MVDPDVNRSIGRELEVHREGYTALADSVAAYLGPSSVAASLMEQAYQEEQQAIQNAQFLKHFVHTCLPLAYSNTFSVSGADAPLIIRRIQSQALWVPQVISYDPTPFYIIGRKLSQEHPNIEDLLLVGASQTHPWTATVPARRDDMKLRDELGQAILGREFSDEEIVASHGTFRIGLERDELTDGCVGTRPGIRKGGKSELEQVRTKGVRTFSKPKLHYKLPKAMIDLYEVDTHVAELAYAFGSEGKLGRLLQSEKPGA